MKDEAGTTLKPCPKCGSDNDLEIRSNRSMSVTQVYCDCGHSFQSRCFEENAGAHWNKHCKKAKSMTEQAVAEEYEEAMCELDKHGIPRSEGDGPTLTLKGRMLRFLVRMTSPSNVQVEPTPEREARREPKSVAFGRSARSVCWAPGSLSSPRQRKHLWHERGRKSTSNLVGIGLDFLGWNEMSYFEAGALNSCNACGSLSESLRTS